ncbi:hypothetical protein DPMN_169304 [Dreissena polymorpha]|uniref:Uncharacterized protein n=1 Tax=Dreissena polymorpha TaxID=45954 RepID=A0A9D4F3G2_DREPO|nr:hypothetical protein DPMN_169304 [Dreissena polymorpha]
MVPGAIRKEEEKKRVLHLVQLFNDICVEAIQRNEDHSDITYSPVGKRCDESCLKERIADGGLSHEEL